MRADNPDDAGAHRHVTLQSFQFVCAIEHVHTGTYGETGKSKFLSPCSLAEISRAAPGAVQPRVRPAEAIGIDTTPKAARHSFPSVSAGAGINDVVTAAEMGHSLTVHREKYVKPLTRYAAATFSARRRRTDDL